VIGEKKKEEKLFYFLQPEELILEDHILRRTRSIHHLLDSYTDRATYSVENMHHPIDLSDDAGDGAVMIDLALSTLLSLIPGEWRVRSSPVTYGQARREGRKNSQRCCPKSSSPFVVK
jgi:hypothetical protein